MALVGKNLDLTVSTATLTWNGAASNVWDSSTLNWSNGSTTLAYINNAPLVFQDAKLSGVGNVTNNNITMGVTNGVSPASITFNNTSSGVAYTITSNDSTNLGITGTTGITLAGTGMVTLAGTNTYSGGTTVNAGTLNINGNAAIGSGKLTLAGGKIDNTSGNAITLSNNNTQTWTGNFTFTGTNDLNLGTGAVTMTVGTVTTTAGNLTEGGILSGSAGLTKLGAGTLTLTGLSTFTGNTPSTGFAYVDIQAGVLSVNNVALNNTASALGSGTGAIALRGGTLQYTGGVGSIERRIELSLAGGTIDASGSGALTWLNTGGLGGAGVGGVRTLTLTGTSTASNTMGVLLNDAGGVFSLVKNGSGTWLLSATNTYTGTTTISGGVLQISGAGQLGSGNYSAAITDNGSLIYASSANQTLGGIISGTTGTLTKSGAGTLTLSGANTYGGSTTLSQGTLLLNSNTTADATGYTLGDANTGANNIVLKLGSGFNSGNTSLPGVGPVRAINATVTNQGSGTATIDFSGGPGVGPDLSLVINRATILKGPYNQIFTTISGPGAGAGNDSLFLDVNGGTFTWTSNGTSNTFTGNVHIINSSGTAGTLNMQNNTYVANDAAHQNLLIPDTASVTLDPNITWNIVWGVETIDALNGSGTIGYNAGTTFLAGAPFLTVGASNGSGSFSGIIGGSGFSFGKAGTGTQTLSGSNTYGGGTTISAGKLLISGSGVLGGGNYSGAITNNGSLVYASSASQIMSGIISGSGTVTMSGTNTLTLSGANSYSGGSTVNSGTLKLDLTSRSNDNGLNLGTINVASAGTLELYANGSPNNYGSTALTSTGTTITGSGTIIKTGAGIVDWWNPGSGAPGTIVNNFSGLIDVQAGTLADQTASTNAWSTSAGSMTLEVETGAYFDPRTDSPVVNQLIGGGTIGSSANSESITVGNQNGSSTFDGIITNSAVPGAGVSGQIISLIKTGIGTFTLTGTNTYTGGTTISGGVLQIGGAGLLGNGNYTATIANSASLVYASSANQTLRGTISGGGSLAMSGSNTLTLTGTAPLSYTGATSITSGNLLLDLSGNSGGIASFSTAVNIGSAGTLTFLSGSTTSADSTFIANSGLAFTGTGTIAKTGSGYLGFMSGGGTGDAFKNFAGLVDVQQGILGNNSAAWNTGPGSMTLNIDLNAQFDIRTSSLKVNKLTGSGTIGQSFSSNQVLTVGAQNGSSTFNGVIQDTLLGSSATGLALTKIGTGTFTLAGNNTYTGTTTISGGVLQLGDGTLGDDGNIATSSAVVDNASLVFNRSTSQTMANTISGSGSVTKIGPGSQSLTGTNTYSGGTTLAAGTLGINFGGTSSANSAIGAGLFTITGGTIDNTSGTPVTLLTNNTQSWNGDFTFAGSNDLNLGIGAVSLGGSRTVTVTAGNLTVGGVISGNTFALNLSGNGTLTLSGANSFNGGLTVSAGTLAIPTINNAGANGTLGNNSFVTLGSTGNNGTLQYNGADASSNMPFTTAAGGTGTLQVVAHNLMVSGLINGTAPWPSWDPPVP